MFKRIIIFVSLLAIANNMYSAAAVRSTDYITKAIAADLANADFDGRCAICQDEVSDISLLFTHLTQKLQMC